MKNKCGWCGKKFKNFEKHHKVHGNMCMNCVKNMNGNEKKQ